MFTQLRKPATIISLLIVGILVVAACAPSTAQRPTTSPTTPPKTVPTTPPSAEMPDWMKLGFSKVLASQDITPGKAATIKADPYTIEAPADAFTAAVKFEVLAGDVTTLKAKAPSGETPEMALAFRVTDSKTGQLIAKFNKPVTLTATSSKIVAQSKYYNLAPDGTYTENPTGLEVKAGELKHPVAGTSVAWVITAPAAATTRPAQVKNPDMLIEATAGSPESLDPAWAYDTASGEVIFNVYETLVFPKKDSTTEFVPMLASKWDISPDGKTYTFTIRKGVKFQDGQDLTPEDVAYSLWRGMIQDRAGGPQWIMLQPFFGLDVQSFKDDVVDKQFNGDWVKAVQALEQAITFDNNAGTATLHLMRPYGPMLQILSGTWAAVVSKPWVIQQGGWNGDPATAEKYHDPAAEQDELFKVMNGTGPYQLDRWAPGEEVDLARNDNYWLKEPLWDGRPSGVAATPRVAIKDISEWGTRFAQLQTGDADIAYVPRQYTSQIDPLVKETCDPTGQCTLTNANGTLRLFKGLPTVQEDVIFFNQDTNATGGNSMLGSGQLDGNGIPANFFSDSHIRTAFNYAFDWNTYIQQVWNGEAEQGLGPIINGELGFDPSQPHYSFDLNQAAEEFKASALKSPDGKSLWDVGFYLQYVYNTGNDQRRTAGEVLKADLAKINPKFKIAVVDEPFPVFLKDQTAGRLPLFMLGWLEDYHDPQDWVVPFLASGGTYGGTQHFAANLQKQMDQLIAQAAQEADPQARTKLYGQLQNLAYENALDIFVVQPQGRHYEQEWVRGWYYNSTYPGIYFYALGKGQ